MWRLVAALQGTSWATISWGEVRYVWINHFVDSRVNILYWDTLLRHCCRFWSWTKKLRSRMGYISSGMVSTWMATCQIHSNCASVCFELQLDCCYGAMSQYNIKETAIAPRRSIWSLISRLEHRRWFGKCSKLMLLVLVFSMKHWKNTVFSCLPNILLWYYYILLLCQFCSIPTMAPQDGWTVCIWNLWNTEVDFRLFSRQKHTSSRTFQVSESEGDFAHLGIWKTWLGWRRYLALRKDTTRLVFILKAYWSGYGMNEDFSLKLPIEGSENL